MARKGTPNGAPREHLSVERALAEFCVHVRQATPVWFEDFQQRRKILMDRMEEKRVARPEAVIAKILMPVIDDKAMVARLAKRICAKLFDQHKASVYACTPNEQATIHKILGLSEGHHTRLAALRDEVLKERGLLRLPAPAAPQNVTFNLLAASLPPDAPPDVRAWYERRALAQVTTPEALPAPTPAEILTVSEEAQKEVA